MNYCVKMNQMKQSSRLKTLQLRAFRHLVRENAVSLALNTTPKKSTCEQLSVLPGIFRTFLRTAGADKLMISLIDGAPRTKVMWRRKLRASVLIGLMEHHESK